MDRARRHAMKNVRDADLIAARDGAPIPEVLAGAIVGAVLMMAAIALVPAVSAVPDVAVVAVGLVAGALLSYVLAPRHVRLAQAHRATPEEDLVRSRAA